MSAIAPSTTSAGTSGYIFDRCPERFGKQELYLSESKKVVTSTASSFLQAVAEKKDLTRLFHETLTLLGQERQRIAKAQGTPNSEVYGARRDHKDSFQGLGGITALFRPYEKYNERLLPIIQKHLRPIDRTLREFKQKEMTIDTGKLGDTASRLDISILSTEDRDQWTPEYTQEYYHKLCSLCGVTPIKGPFDPNIHFKPLVENRDAMQRLKQTSMVDYKKLKLAPVLAHCYSTFTGRKSDWVLATVRTEIDKKMVALSQYVTWMNRDFKTDPVEHMIEETFVLESGEIRKKNHRNSDITLLHQDPFLIDLTLNEIAKLFKQAIECNDSDVAALSSTVAHLRYLYSHTMPFFRGSSATCEWLEQAIYLFKGYDLEYKKTLLIDMEALTLPLKDFVKLYPLMIKLTKQESKTS